MDGEGRGVDGENHAAAREGGEDGRGVAGFVGAGAPERRAGLAMIREDGRAGGEVRWFSTVLLDPVTRRLMPAFVFDELRDLGFAAVERHGAARVKAAA